MIKQFSAEDADNPLENAILPRATVTSPLGVNIYVIEELLKVC